MYPSLLANTDERILIQSEITFTIHLSSRYSFVSILEIIVRAYNNGKYTKTGAGYGFRIKKSDVINNSKIFTSTIFVTMDSKLQRIPIHINQNSILYGESIIFTKKEIGLWLIQHMMGHWKDGDPPEFFMKHDKNNHFKIKKIKSE